MPTPFVDKLATTWPPEQWKDVTIVLAVSGGADSVSLLRGVVELSRGGLGRVVAAHFNHGLRPNEADLDEGFVVALSQKLDVSCVVGHADRSSAPSPPGKGSESTAREARYRFLRETAGQWGARYVATAHTADDQAETILHRIVRGTGLRGLRGIPRARPLSIGVTLFRPLLSFRRREVHAYLQGLGQDFREDSSNQDCRFTRNRIRRRILPQLAEGCNHEVVSALVRLGSLAEQVQLVVDGLANELVHRCVTRDETTYLELDCRPLAHVAPVLASEVFATIWRLRHWPLKDMGFHQWSELAAIGRTQGAHQASKMFPGGIRAERVGERLKLELDGGSTFGH